MKKLLVALVLVAAVALGGLFLFRAEAPNAALGASSGPDQVGSDHYSWNGVVIYPLNKKMTNATTTVCAFKTPAATTTLTKFSANFPTPVSTTSAPTVYLANSTTAFSTTTNLATFSFAQSAAGTVVATSSIQTGGKNIIAPNTWLVVAIQGQGAFYDPQGTCQFEVTGV
jgi:hypothetical protein